MTREMILGVKNTSRWSGTTGGTFDVTPTDDAETLLGMVENRRPDVTVVEDGLSRMHTEILIRLLRERSPRTTYGVIAGRDAEGATFRVGRRSDPGHLERTALRALTHEPAMDRPSSLIFIVDRDELFRRYLYRILHGADYRTVQYESTFRALKSVDDIPPDLVILDSRLSLPKSAKWSRKNSGAPRRFPPGLPVLHLWPRDSDGTTGLRKPVAPRDILERVGELTRRA